MVCPVAFRRKVNIGMWTIILMSFKNFNVSHKDISCTVNRTSRRKTVVNLEHELSI